jgi:PadR family transcriptional regulator
MRPEIMKGHLDLLLLTAVSARPAHGYAIVSELNRLSAGAFQIPEGTIYPALYRLERAGLLSSAWSGDSGRQRRNYELTVAGRRALDEYRDEWERFSAGVEAVLKGATWPA